MKTTAQKIEVMQAFLDGKKIEERFWLGNWVTCLTPQWNWERFDYRVAEEPKKSWFFGGFAKNCPHCGQAMLISVVDSEKLQKAISEFQKELRREEPKLVQWVDDDIPHPTPRIRQINKAMGHVSFNINNVSPYGITIIDNGKQNIIPYSELLEYYEYSTDGKTWLPCGKEI